MATNDQWERLVDSFDSKESQHELGFFYVYWGILNTLGVWIFTLVWPENVFWVVWILSGLVLMQVLIHIKTRRAGRVLLNGNTIPRIWVALLVVLPFLIWVFPTVLNIYPSDWVFSLTNAWVCLGIYATGAYAKRKAIAWGSLAFGVAAIASRLFPDQGPWILTGASVLGLIVPGVVTSYEERH